MSLKSEVTGKVRLAVLSMCALGIAASTAAQAQSAPPPPTKEIRIYNNSLLGPIYPVLSTPKQGKDEWLQAILLVPKADLKQRHYGNDFVYRVYVNPTTGGIPMGGEVVLTVPLYTQILGTDQGDVQDEFVDWWKGGRVGLYDQAKAIKRDYTNDSANPTTPIDGAMPVSCVKGCTEPLAIFHSAVGQGDLPSNDPAQLTEYTMGGINEATDPIGFIVKEVDYDISYVDQVYLPVAMEAVDAPFIGWVGTDQGVGEFKQGLQNFLNSPKYPGWPTYLDNKMQPFLRIPSPAIIYAAESGANPSPDISPPGEAFNAMTRYWKGCTTGGSGTPSCSRIQDVQKLFLANYAQYKLDWTAAGCQGTLPAEPDVDKSLLPHVYGWSAYNETPGDAKCTAGITNALFDTPGYTKKTYQEVQDTYKILQYETMNGVFNPYVQLVHYKPFLDMANAYSFSIDDAVGNMQTVGGGLIIAVGGVKGLPNPAPFDKKKKVEVTVGAPGAGFPTWNEYGFCSPYPAGLCQVSRPYPTFSPLSFNLETVVYPTQVTLLDSAGKEYKFVILKGPPYKEKVRGQPLDTSMIQCLNLFTSWCPTLGGYTDSKTNPLVPVNAIVAGPTIQ